MIKVNPFMTDSTVAPYPQWELSNIYPGLQSPEFSADMQRLQDIVADFEALFASPFIQQAGPQSSAAVLGEAATALI